MRPTLAALPLLLLACADGPATAVRNPPDVVAPPAYRGPDDRDSDRGAQRSLRVHGAVSDGETFIGTFVGTIRVREFTPQKGQAIGSGSIVGIARGDIAGRVKRARGGVTEVAQSFQAPMKMTAGAGRPAQSLEIIPAQGQACSILVISLGVIDVNVLSSILQLRLNVISLDLGAGGPVGALLCSLVQLQV